MMKIDVLVSRERYYSKTHLLKNAAKIRSNIINNPMKLTVQEVADRLVNGHTVAFGYFENDLADACCSLSNRHWRWQQVFAVDIDQDKSAQSVLTIDEAVKLCKEKWAPPAFVYTTYSHTEAAPCFRVVFVLDRVVTDAADHEKVIRSLQSLFTVGSTNYADTSCCDLSRMFFPGREIVYANYDEVVNYDTLLKNCDEYLNSFRGEISAYKAKKVNESRLTENIRHLFDRDVDYFKKLMAEDLAHIGVEHFSNPGSLEIAGSEGDFKMTDHKYLNYNNNIPLGVDSSMISSSLTKVFIVCDFAEPASPVTARVPGFEYLITPLLDLGKFLGVPVGQNFPCLLPGHKDGKPSARIEIDKRGRYVYHCYAKGCGGPNVYYDIFDVIERITGWSHSSVRQFIFDVLGVQPHTEWQKKQRQMISDYHTFVMTQFEKRYPVLYQYLRRRNLLGTLQHLLLIAQCYLYDVNMTNDNRSLFVCSYLKAAKQMSDFGQKVTISALKYRIYSLVRLGLIGKLSDDELPNFWRKVLTQYKLKKHYAYRENVYFVPTFTMQLFQVAEQKILLDKRKSVRMYNYSRNTEIFAYNQEMADQVFVQDKHRAVSKHLGRFYENYKAVAASLINGKGWTTEQEILSKMRGYSKVDKKRYSVACLPRLLDDLKFVRLSLNKEIKQRYKISDSVNYRTKVIVRKDW